MIMKRREVGRAARGVMEKIRSRAALGHRLVIADEAGISMIGVTSNRVDIDQM